eukprot:gene1323-1667_t
MKTMIALALLGTLLGAASAAADCTGKQLKAFDQCGGKANCEGPQCVSGTWAHVCCPAGHQCIFNNEWYSNCQPSGKTNPAQPSTPSSSISKSAPAPATNNNQASGPAGPATPAPAVVAKKTGGGWYDAGDNVKFNLPMAWSAAVLAWSVLEFTAGYKAANQYNIALDNIKWVTDYFIKCVGDGKSIVVQVGNGAQDHAIWGRPEDVKGPVPVYTVTPDKPGSDAVGAMGAALAAASQVFKTVNPGYSQQLLQASIKAYNFASKYPGSYSNSVADAASFYRSSNYMDDIAFNALWLHIRTGESQYKQAGLDWFNKFYQQEDGTGVWENFDWDSNSWGCLVLLNRLFPSNPTFQSRLDTFIAAWTKGTGTVQYTPKGLAFSGPWGSLRHVGNALFLMKTYANKAGTPAIKRAVDCTTRSQLGYILGDTGRSFVVGYGSDSPKRPHHRASSCPAIGTECTWDYFNTASPNPHTLFGALVGGPGADDSYVDARNDFIKNEVATDYNAGFT